MTVLLLAVVALVAVYGYFFGTGQRRHFSGSGGSEVWPVRRGPLGLGRYEYYNPGDPTHQLKAVIGASFTTKRVMNFSEFKVFRTVEQVIRQNGGGYRVFSQTALGEVLDSPNRFAHQAINSKRVDVLIVSPNGFPVAVIEYQGKGHFQGAAAARDAVKREALRKAGVEYVEILDFHTDEHVSQAVRDVLIRADSARRKDALQRKSQAG